MSLRLRLGPVSVSSRGRVGVRAGPFYWSGGGGRRRPPRRPSRGSSGLGTAVVYVLLAALVVGAVIAYWYIIIPATILLIGFLGWKGLRDDEKRAQLAASREVERAAAEAAWLAAPAPPLEIPTRFSEQWFEQRVPMLHPGQLPQLEAALRSRGWSDQKIRERLSRHLDRNPWLRPSGINSQ